LIHCALTDLTISAPSINLSISMLFHILHILSILTGPNIFLSICLAKIRRLFSSFAVKIQASDEYITTGLIIICISSVILYRLEFKWTITVFFSGLLTLSLLTVYTTVSVLRNTLLHRYDTITSHVSQTVFPPSPPTHSQQLFPILPSTHLANLFPEFVCNKQWLYLFSGKNFGLVTSGRRRL
jgi:hypothetical protein